ncbi:hypothetical protein KCU61_g749, partial [Aureobasidium melanogenum]
MESGRRGIAALIRVVQESGLQVSLRDSFEPLELACFTRSCGLAEPLTEISRGQQMRQKIERGHIGIPHQPSRVWYSLAHPFCSTTLSRSVDHQKVTEHFQAALEASCTLLSSPHSSNPSICSFPHFPLLSRPAPTLRETSLTHLFFPNRSSIVHSL